MSVKYSGLLKFTDEIKAEIDLAADGAVEKAVIIDGEGVETPIGGGGGGGSDFSMAEVTLVNSADSNRAVLIPVCYEPSQDYPDASVESTVQMVVNDTLKLNVPLYKGHCSIRKGISEDRLQGVTVATSFTVTSGSATSSMEGVDITGDCTITVS